MRPHIGFQSMQEGQPMGRRQRLRAEPFAQRHSDQIDRLLGQATGVLRSYSVGALAELIDKIMSELLQRPIRTKADRCQRLRARDPALQHLARYLQDNLRESVVELQFIRARRIVDRELTWTD